MAARIESRGRLRSEKSEVKVSRSWSQPPGEEGLGTLRQGYLEESSVDPVREITELIKAQRGYELNAKVIAQLKENQSIKD